MADSVHLLNGDDLDEDLLAEALGRTGISNYVERGLCKTLDTDDVDFANAVVDIPAGKAFILDNGRDSMLLADARAGVELGTDGDQHIYICYDLNQPEGERIEFQVSASQTEPALPSLRIAVIDMVSESVDPVNDFAPINDEDAVYVKGNDIDSDGDGIVNRADTAGVADSANAVAGADVNGPVARAGDADGLGGNVSEATLAAALAAHGFDITDVGLLSAESAEIGLTDGVAIGAGEGGTVDITPRIGGSLQSANRTTYTTAGIFNDPTWAYQAGISTPILEVSGDVGAGEGDGMVFRPIDGDSIQLLPKIGGVYRYGSGVTFEMEKIFNEPTYQMDGHLFTPNALMVGGTRGRDLGWGAEEGLLIRDVDGMVQIAPKIGGTINYGDALEYDGSWGTYPGAAASANSVDGSNVNGTVANAGFAGAADDANKLGGRTLGEVHSLQSASVPSAVLDPGESVWTPIYAGGDSLRILSLSTFDGNFNASSGLRASIKGTAGDSVAVDGQPTKQGSYASPVVVLSDSGRYKLLLENNTGGKITAGAACRFVRGD